MKIPFMGKQIKLEINVFPEEIFRERHFLFVALMPKQNFLFFVPIEVHKLKNCESTSSIKKLMGQKNVFYIFVFSPDSENRQMFYFSCFCLYRNFLIP